MTTTSIDVESPISRLSAQSRARIDSPQRRDHAPEGVVMNLSAPRVLFFIISLVIAILAVLAYYVSAFAVIESFWIMTIAYVILALACIIKGV
jgi:uncharacterized membrane protein